MDVSVIVVTYNQEDTIARTLDSILAQKVNFEYEIVIGDDCSSDRTGEICLEYVDRHPERIRYFRHAENLGVVANYFDCISRASGRYLADCAGDDYWCDPMKLQKQFDILEKRPDVTLVATQYKEGNWPRQFSRLTQAKAEETETFWEKDPENGCPAGEYGLNELAVPFITHEKVVHLCTALYRKVVIERMVNECPALMTDSAFACEDLQIVLASLASGRVVVLPEVTLHYSIGHESVSHKKTAAKQYHYSSRVLRQLQVMIEAFVKDPTPKEKKKLDRFERNMGDYVLAMAFQGRQKVTDFPRITGLKGWIYKILLRLMNP